MATKKLASTVPVVKHKSYDLKRLGTRMTKEFAGEIASDIAAGYKVFTLQKRHDGVHIQMGKTEEWTVEDFLAEVREMLESDS